SQRTRARVSVFEIGSDFKLDSPLAASLRIDEASGTVATRIAALNDKVQLVAMKFQPIVESALDQIDEVAGGDGSFVLIELDCDAALICFFVCFLIWSPCFFLLCFICLFRVRSTLSCSP